MSPQEIQAINDSYKKLLENYEETLQKAVAFVPEGFGIKNFRSLKTSDGLAFNADVTYNKKRVGYIENGGTGGPDNIRFDDKDVRAIWAAAVEQLYATDPESGRFSAEERMCDAFLTKEGY